MKRPASIDTYISSHSGAIPEDRLDRLDRYTRDLFEKALRLQPDGTVFVLTGDIPAMWIRDSTWQMLPLLSITPDDELIATIAGVSRLQARQLLIDPYANAFNESANGNCWLKDFPDQSPWVFERKFEIDSLAAFFELAVRLYTSTGCTLHLDADFWKATQAVADVIDAERQHDSDSYVLVRPDAPATDSLSHGGVGAPFTPNGLVWSGFRPSDDRCVLPFFIPGNAHLAVVLRKLSVIAEACDQSAIAARLSALSDSINAALKSVLAQHELIPYEVDGRGNAVFSDDPNFPSLISLPFLGWCSPEDEQYRKTRGWLLSDDNPRFRRSAIAEGLSSEHTPETHIWPLAIAMRGLTATSRDEALSCLETLERSDGGTGSMHESFDVGNPVNFTRPWFSWADMAYCQLLLKLYS
jgi:meiotically up-regulated gene 157 (Mug157) protein